MPSEGDMENRKTLEDLIRDRANVKSKMDGLNAELKELRKTQDEIDYELLKKLDDQGVTKTGSDVASVSIREDMVPEVTDWDSLYAHVTATGDFGLLQRRVSSTAYKEALKLGEQVPGLQPREIRRINFRSN
tara:strand:- start:5401 stop:5796 length:396 start_codon:yes stop_codon:yes gene_type:complete